MTYSQNYRIQSNGDGTLDEVWAPGRWHLEQMTHNNWWMALYLPDEAAIVVNLWTPRTPIRAHWSYDKHHTIPGHYIEAGEFHDGIVPPPTLNMKLSKLESEGSDSSISSETREPYPCDHAFRCFGHSADRDHPDVYDNEYRCGCGELLTIRSEIYAVFGSPPPPLDKG